MCAGSAVAQKAAKLKKGDRIKLGETDVQTKFDKAKGVTYTNFYLFGFDMDAGHSGGGDAAATSAKKETKPEVGDGNIDDSGGGDLPW